MQTIAEDGDAVLILDQTLLPRQISQRRLNTLAEVADAIRSMQVRGAPLIGACAAYGVALALRRDAGDDALDAALGTLAATRPTAVNLDWALARMRRVIEPLAPALRAEAAWIEARAIAAADAAANAAIGRHGLDLLAGIAAGAGRREPVRLMTHCNAGWLATVRHGTALAPVYAAHDAGVAVHVWVSETRPRNQGLLSVWELARAGVPHTLIADNAAGLLMMRGQVDIVVVGADRIAANGDTANKVGTYLKALAARAHGIPFYVAAPVSTIDHACPDGERIPIEERDSRELGAGAEVPVANPAFDVTPANLIAGIITERGVIPPGNLGELA
ncbi:methylthioribose-1-phosphate isomerase [mine drainage metagenome]|uniref:Methylthioribose-1-phosphate isomerase n=1 Tax=mine drainage metagenome TaxID=410659 RepID=A0A1J5RLY6_9ZZZZ